MTPRLHSSISPLLLCALSVLCVSTLLAAEHWPQFRGADARDVSTNTNLSDKWSVTESVEWKTPIPGRGWSSPVVWGERVFLTAVINRGETEVRSYYQQRRDMSFVIFEDVSTANRRARWRSLSP